MPTYTQDDLERFASNDDLLELLDAAEERDDAELVMKLRGQIIWPAESLLATRNSRGADWLVKMGFNLSEADRKYGANWLQNDQL